MEKLVLIDGNSLLNRAYFATPVFTTKDGQPTNAIFGFIKLLLKVIDTQKPEYLLVAFDMKAPTFRHEMYDGYKATRKGMPDDLAAQLQPLKDLLCSMGIAMYGKEGLEADDILGSVSRKFDVHSYIYTGDRDAYQLVDEKTDVNFTVKGVSYLKALNAENFYSEMGINPSQVIDMKSLMGDTSDNIPGVAGVGEKSAKTLIDEYGTLDGVYENLESVKGALKTKLENGKDSAYMSYTLATIRRDADIDVKLEELSCPKKFGADAKRMFAALEFKSLLSLDIFGEDAADAEKSIEYPEKTVSTDKTAILFFIRKGETFYADLSPETLQIYSDGEILEITYTEGLFSEFSQNDFVFVLKALFENSAKKVIFYDSKLCMHILQKLGVDMTASFDDVSVMTYLSDISVAADLKSACTERLIDKNFSSYGLKLIHDEATKELTGDLKKLYDEIEFPLIKVLFDMESRGITVSKREMGALGDRYNQKIKELSDRIFSLCGEPFNLNSPAQLGDVLFNKLGIKGEKPNKKGQFSTSAEVLEKHINDHEVVGLVLKYRQYMKLYSTYVEGFRPLIAEDGKVHTTYNQTITATGRLSSSNPNMQNIPVRDEEGKELRKMFVPMPGCVLIDADYSQIELRLLAHFSGCETLISAYNNGEDIHTVTASKVFGVVASEVTPKMRREAKAVNFGIIYGISDFGLANNLSISTKEAKTYIDNYFTEYPEVKAYMNSNVEFARENGYVTTLMGRKRIIPELKASQHNVRQFGERAAMNMPLQGTSADIIKIAMVNVAKALEDAGLKSRLILQVHDELVIEAPEEEAEAASEILKREMENAVSLKVPLSVETRTGENWYDAK
ncbi:MAG: DNA polymerase I [Clostridia bacterium]|nr:DNA polymerase I [Clostridia bacterium]